MPRTSRSTSSCTNDVEIDIVGADRELNRRFVAVFPIPGTGPPSNLVGIAHLTWPNRIRDTVCALGSNRPP
jgi:hypothetical protein